MTTSLSLPGRVYLLAFDRERDRLGSRMWLGYALRAAALAELVVDGRVIDEGGRGVAVAGVRPPNDPVLRAVLEDLGGRTWRALASRRRREIENAVAAQLDASGHIRILRPTTVWRRSRIELHNPRLHTRLTERVSAILRGSVPVDRTPPVDVALVAILAVAEIRSGMTKSQRKEYADRVTAAIKSAGPPIDGLKHAISQARASAAGG